MNQKQKGKYVGLLGALLVHLLAIAFLFIVGFSVPERAEEEGLPVMLGEVQAASGLADPTLVKVDVMPTAMAQEVETPTETDMLTQDMEETVAIEPRKAPEEKKKEVKQPEQSAAEKAEEARRLAEAEAERKRKEVEEAARRRVAGAFVKSTRMADKGNSTGTGIQGSAKGNETMGATTGVGGYGTFSLGGRTIGEGGLPRPAYNVQDEGRVVVTIIVNPEGKVISTSINKQTNTVNPSLRKAAEEAAAKARFNAVEGFENQQGTITYYFNLK